MTSSEARLAEIAGLAEQVAADHCPSGRVEPELILRRNDITFNFGRYAAAFDGMLEHIAGRFHVYANLERLKSPQSGRARFTLAHELGHYYIDEHRRALLSGSAPRHQSVCDFQSRNPAEIEADHFACHLLMPEERFSKSAKELSLGCAAVLKLKDDFGTSITSTAIRCTRLNLGPYTLIKWKADGFAWKHFSNSTFAAGYRRTIEDVARVPHDSPTGRALSGATPPESGFFEAGTSAAAWFPGIGQGSMRDAIFIEQAIPLGEYGVLTLLFPERRKFETASI